MAGIGSGLRTLVYMLKAPMATAGPGGLWENVRCFGVTLEETEAICLKLQRAGMVATEDAAPPFVWKVDEALGLLEIEKVAQRSGVDLNLGLKAYLAQA